jgi:Tfp pilus assembly protein PilF
MDSVFQRAMELHQAGRPEDAAPLYEDVIRHDPRHPGAWHLLGVVHLGRGDIETACKHIERALSLCDTKAVYYNNYGAVLKELGRLDEAKVAFERAVELNQDYADAWSNLGWARLERDEPEGAEEALQRALELDPRHLDALVHLARLHQDCGELGKAIECHGRAIALRPTDAALHNGLGGTCLVARQWEQAQEACRRAVSLDPGCSEAWANLASAYSMQDRVTVSRLR